jgi:hypothetical protein
MKPAVMAARMMRVRNRMVSTCMRPSFDHGSPGMWFRDRLRSGAVESKTGAGGNLWEV